MSAEKNRENPNQQRQNQTERQRDSEQRRDIRQAQPRQGGAGAAEQQKNPHERERKEGKR